jgi:hypothetical protein
MQCSALPELPHIGAKVMAEKVKLEFTSVDIETLPSDLKEAFDEYKETRKSNREDEEREEREIERLLIEYLHQLRVVPPGKEVRVSLKYGMAFALANPGEGKKKEKFKFKPEQPEAEE